MMNAETREKAKAIALDRMKKLKLMGNPIKEFAKDGTVNISENGILFWANDEQKKQIAEIEEERDVLVYHGIHSMTNIGEMTAYLIVTGFEVSDDEEAKFERETAEEGLKDGYVLAYVVNHTYPDCSEMGDVVVREQFGGLVRVG